MANSVKEVMAQIRRMYTEDISNKLQSEFVSYALSLFAFSSPVYTSEMRNSWSFNKVNKTNGFSIEFGNSSAQALYSEYGTLSKYSPNHILVNGRSYISETSRSKIKKTTGDMSAKDAIFAWCEYQGITDDSIKYAIYKNILRYGREKNDDGPMASVVPKVYQMLKDLSKEVFK